MSKDLISVCWILTSKCNYNCSFCFKIPNKKDITQKQAEKILLQLKEANVKKISFGGGEPLLWSGDIFSLIKKTKKLGIVTMLTTNGSLLTKEKLEKLKGNLDWITLPIDGSDEEHQVKTGRPKDHFTKILKLLNTLESSNFKVKINTVLSKRNLDDIENIAKLVKKYKIIKRWKVFQFFPIRHTALTNRKSHEITEKQFKEIENKVKKILKDSDCEIYFSANTDFESSYFTINQSGLVQVSRNGKDTVLGDLRKQSVKDIWEETKLINKDEHIKRASWFIK